LKLIIEITQNTYLLKYIIFFCYLLKWTIEITQNTYLDHCQDEMMWEYVIFVLFFVADILANDRHSFQ
jgi:hypothetical protein